MNCIIKIEFSNGAIEEIHGVTEVRLDGRKLLLGDRKYDLLRIAKMEIR